MSDKELLMVDLKRATESLKGNQKWLAKVQKEVEPDKEKKEMSIAYYQDNIEHAQYRINYLKKHLKELGENGNSV